jgi:hypothetical protein
MNGTKVRDLITTIGDIHHIFPKKYLQNNGISDKSKYNQIANYTYLDTATNISIGEKAPCEYFKIIFEQCETKVLKYGNITEIEILKDNLKDNCIPKDIVLMNVDNYDDFLLERRKLMAKKIKEYYYKL